MQEVLPVIIEKPVVKKSQLGRLIKQLEQHILVPANGAKWTEVHITPLWNSYVSEARFTVIREEDDVQFEVCKYIMDDEDVTDTVHEIVFGAHLSTMTDQSLNQIAEDLDVQPEDIAPHISVVIRRGLHNKYYIQFGGVEDLD